jgi:hypothetical protein
MTPPDSAVLEYSSTPSPPSAAATWGNTLGWSAYLGCSWTWCIGMFLPVLLIRDYGVAAWWAFAIPNVIGAAAMGWVVRSRWHSEKLIEMHLPAIHAFSFITVAFMTFFAMWVIAWQSMPQGLGLIVICLTALLGLAGLGYRFDRSACVATLCLSALIWIAGTGLGYFPRIAPDLGRGTIPQIGLLPLSSVMIFGFLLCPYLDQTFHRARQSSDSGKPRVTFAVGFGVFFAAMIVFTLCYSAWPLPFVSDRWGRFTNSPVYDLLALHMLTQAVVTTAMHLREPIGVAAKSGGRGTRSAVALIAGFIIAIATRSRFELVYRLFMSAYGLLFPAYVLICMKPWRAPRPPSLRDLIAFTFAVLVAAPMYWLAFVDGKMLLLLPALGWIGLLWLATSCCHQSERPA